MVISLCEDESQSSCSSKLNGTCFCYNVNYACILQVLSETVASALQVLTKDDTVETRLFIRMMDCFFDCLNVKSPRQGILERKEYRRPYSSHNDHRFKVFSKSPACIYTHAHPQSYIHTCTITQSHTPAQTHLHTHTCTHTHTAFSGWKMNLWDI